MATPKELRLPTSAFNGNKEKSTQWLFQTKAYLRVNETSYDTDEKKVIFALAG